MWIKISKQLSWQTAVLWLVWMAITAGYLWWLFGRLNQAVELPENYQSVVTQLDVELVKQAADKLKQAQPLTPPSLDSSSPVSDSSQIDK